ncbi:hypothetical protein BOTBODRAFT_173510 [Botryobasidium botryosum FD-172 SS1]|uniref:Uncharacterized protein n=1 Tax=Botryobasidium botryosum (strain FD-172 SS1) TaxID=930990 RepID=A0A067MVH7_BOTB1|nr:hypothetical protein BOTBODRAFT_173510 [Botryobasidium botryosum FD-172 SS1]
MSSRSPPRRRRHCRRLSAQGHPRAMARALAACPVLASRMGRREGDFPTPNPPVPSRLGAARSQNAWWPNRTVAANYKQLTFAAFWSFAVSRVAP